jgi:phage recombination protein Bet
VTPEVQSGALVHQPAAPGPVITREQVELLKDTICRGATDEELRLFIEVCNRKNLDPFGRQIYMIKRWDSDLKRNVMTFQTGIDGFRTIAARTGKYEGQMPPLWCGPDGKWKDVWLDSKPPAAAKIAVYRAGFREPIVAVALYSEYVQKTRDGHPNSMWQKMPANQLCKCCESGALRKAFPEDLSGMYTDEEMGQADNEPPTRGRPPMWSPRPAAAVEPGEPIDQTPQPLSPESVLDQILGNFSRDPKVIDPTFAELREEWKKALPEDALDQILMEHGLGPGEARMVSKAKRAFTAAWHAHQRALQEREEEQAREQAEAQEAQPE